MSRKTRKLMWSVPLLAALAVVSALAIFVAQMPGAVLAHDPPGAVSNLKAEADGTRAVDLRWDAPTTGTPTGYRIDASADGQIWMSLMADTGNGATTYRDDMIVNFLGSDRFYRVFALNSSGTSSVSQTVGPVSVPDAGAPGNVTGVSATAVGRKAIRLTWEEPASTGGSPITRYVIAFGPTEAVVPPVTSFPGADDIEFADGGMIRTPDATRTHTVTGLSAAQSLFFRVYAYNGDKVSAGHSETRSATTGSLGKIGPVTGLRAVPDPILPTVELYWYWPADDGGRDITHWLVERKQTGLATGQTADLEDFKDWVAAENAQAVDPAVALDYQDTNLTPGAKYQYRVTARTGSTDADVLSSITTRSGVSNTVTVNATLMCPRPPLADNAPAAERAMHMAETARCAVSNARVPDDSVAVERDGKGNVEVTVTRENPRKATSFRIDVSPDGNKWQSVTNYTGNLGSDDEFVVEYLDETTGGDLHYRVFAYVGNTQLLPSNPGPVEAGVKTVSLPGKVESLKATAVSQTQIDVTWSAPLKDGDAPVDMYCVQISDDDGDSLDAPATDTAHADEIPTDLDTAASLCAGAASQADAAGAADTFLLTDQTTYSHKKLKANQTQYYKIYAINNPVFGGDGRSETSDTVSKTTAKQDKPVMPTGLVGETARDSNYGGRVNSGVYLLWNAPPNPTGGDVESYAVQRKVNGGSWSDLDSDTENDRTIYHDTSEPAAGEQRAYRVAAKNSSGTGPWSYVAYYPVMMHTHNTAPTAVGMIAPVTVTAGEMSDAMDVSSYFSDADTSDTLTYTASSGMEMYATVEVAGSMLTITGVAAGIATITVTATDTAGDYVMQTIMVTVEAADVTLSAPSGVMTSDATDNPGKLLVKVDWTPGNNAVGHLVMLFTDDWQGAPMVEGMPTGNSHTFSVDAGSYIAVVVAYDADAKFRYSVSGVTTVGQQ